MEYQTFTGNITDLPLDKEVELIVRDLTPGPRKYNSHRVIAVLSSKPLKEAHTLWVRSRSGVRYPNPLYMRIVKELELVK